MVGFNTFGSFQLGKPFGLARPRVYDVVASVLSAAAINQTGDTTANVAVSTTETGGSLFWIVVETVNEELTFDDIVAGEDGLGDPAAASGYIDDPDVGSNGAAVTGLAAGTEYWVVWCQTDRYGNRSNVLASAASATTTGGV